jgi:hypothetical protein
MDITEQLIVQDMQVHAGILQGEPKRPDFHRGIIRGLALALQHRGDGRTVQELEWDIVGIR